MLRAGGCRKRRRARCWREDVGINEQARREEVRGYQAPTPGIPERVVTELIHNSQLVGDEEGRGQIAGERRAVRQGRAVQAESPQPVARQPVKHLACGRRVSFSIRVVQPSREVQELPVVTLKTELLGREVITVPAIAEIA